MCIDIARCVPTHYPIDFEGRPANGAVPNAGHTHVWELKYGFSIFGGVQYAANLWYKIAGTEEPVERTVTFPGPCTRTRSRCSTSRVSRRAP